jgi:hypothetical protein
MSICFSLFKFPAITRYERVSIEKLLGELQFNPHMTNGITHPTISPLLNNPHLPKQNGFLDYPSTLPTTINSNSSPKMPPGISPPSINTITPPSNVVSSLNDLSTVKPLMADTYTNGTIDAFEEFRRMAAQIHQQFNAPYSKVINAASSPSPSISMTDGVQSNGGSDKNTRPLSTISQNKMLPTSTFTKSWKVEHTAGTLNIFSVLSILYFYSFSTEFSLYDTISNTHSICR